jgi:phosphoglucosamine mutase
MLAEVMQKLPQLTRNVKVKHKVPLERLPEMAARLAEIESELSDAGRVLFRYSGTESLARITIEGPDQVQIRSYLQELEGILLQEIAQLNS